MSYRAGMTLELIEKEAIESAFKFFQGNKTHTADALGISIRTLDAKLEKYKKDSDDRATHVQEEAARLRTARQASQEADARAYLESITQNSTKPTVSVPEREEVQSMSSAETTGSGDKRAGKNLRGSSKTA